MMDVKNVSPLITSITSNHTSNEWSWGAVASSLIMVRRKNATREIRKSSVISITKSDEGPRSDTTQQTRLRRLPSADMHKDTEVS